MINKKSVDAVNASRFGSEFSKPLYDSYCFSRIPGTILQLLTGNLYKSLPYDVLPANIKRYKKVIFLFVDAFGWKFFENVKKHSTIHKFIENGVVSKLTSQFPSTTPVHVTTINTGADVGDHGVYEWFYYEPKLDAVIAPLLFSFAKDAERDTLKTVNADPKELYPAKTIYTELKKSGVKSYVFSDKEYVKSPYNEIMSKDVSKTTPYTTISEAFTLLADSVINEKDKAYFYLYYGKIDSMGHHYGSDSKEFKAELDTYLTSLERILFEAIKDKSEDTLVLLSADHGQANMFPQKTIYLNKILPEIGKYFLKTRKGEPIVPAGSCRDMFLHVQPKYIDVLKEELDKKLEGKAEIYKTTELIENGFFGSTNPSKEFLSRVGNLVILPYKDQAVWWFEEGIFEQDLLGHHGGMTKDEIEIPLLALSF